MITYDRYQRIKEIFHSAQEHHTPAERSAFLTEVCGDDTAMREELEALLTADAENDDFLIESAYEYAAGMLADELREFSPGQEVGQYRIECFLSSGGMGQIYEAHDTKLGRKIALKFISPEYAKDTRRVQRFEQEARAASALNHPNVCVIHDVGVTDTSRHFIAMEFIQGPTLRDELARRTFRPLEALEIIIQVGDALASAHAKGIVHRDIKPENIMLRHDGYVKVVDFGLAKLTELLPEQQPKGEEETRVLTEQHMIMGTVRYMSPEQLREAPVDERTDIWSLGIVLYEMLTGTTPFKARAPNESIALILSSQLQFNEEIPVKLRDILKKALEKDCAQRYQTITKLTADLRSLKRELEMNAGTEFHPVHEFHPPAVSDRRRKERTTGSEILTRLKSQAILTADTLFTEIRTPRGAAIFLSLTVLLFLVPLAMSWINETNKRDKLFQGSVKKLTQDGKAICATISPDDEWVAYAEDQNGKQRLVVTNTINSVSTVAIPPDDVQYLGIAFSRDSQYLYFTRIESGLGILYRLAWPGNNPIKLKEGVDSPISLSPQGDRFAFVRYDVTKTEFYLVLANIDGTNEQVVANRKDGRTLSLNGVAWSPDGNMIVCPVGDRSQGWRMKLIAFDLQNGGEQQIGNQFWYSIQQVAWQPDLSGPIISASTGLTSPHQLFQIPFPDGDVHRITTDPSEYTTSVSLSGKKLVTISTDRQWRIWVGPLDNLQAMTEIVRGSSLNYGLSWSSNGNIFFSSMTQDGLNIYRINPDGSNKVQLTSAPGDHYMPVSTPDGRFIVFVSDRSGTANIWRINADDGSEPTQLTHGDGDFYPACSPDNQWVAYDNLTHWKASVWKVPMTGGAAIRVAENYRMPAFSPDSQLIACRYDRESGSRDVAIFPAQGGEALQHFEVPRQDWQSVRFFQNNRELSFVKNEDGYSNIWIGNLKTGMSKQITNFKSDQIYAYAWSPDYKQIALLRGTKTNNVAIISNSER